MNSNSDDADSQLWRRLVEAHLRLAATSREFMLPGADRVGMIRRALSQGFDPTAAWMLEFLPQADLKELFPELFRFASYGHGAVGAFRKAIVSLPREWVLSRIVQELPGVLAVGDDDSWRRVLELCMELDRGLTLDLARRAIAHSDPDIREAGADFLGYIEKSG